ncbi:MAG: sigma factor, partial [Pseudomonadota bacterium]
MSTPAEYDALLVKVLSRASLKNYAARIVDSEDDAEDVIQNVALKMLGRGSTIDNAERYAQRSIRNASFDLRRSAAARSAREEQEARLASRLEPVADIEIAFAKLKNALDNLPVLTSQIFQMHYFD